VVCDLVLYETCVTIAMREGGESGRDRGSRREVPCRRGDGGHAGQWRRRGVRNHLWRGCGAPCRPDRRRPCGGAVASVKAPDTAVALV